MYSCALPALFCLDASKRQPSLGHAPRLRVPSRVLELLRARQVLGTYKPLVWEYARLGITYNVLSKRKLKKLVTEGHVSGWDDPRLLTLAGLRRRGARPQACPPFPTTGSLPLKA